MENSAEPRGRARSIVKITDEVSTSNHRQISSDCLFRCPLRFAFRRGFSRNDRTSKRFLRLDDRTTPGLFRAWIDSGEARMFVSDKNFPRRYRGIPRTTNPTKKQPPCIVVGIFPRHFRPDTLFLRIRVDQRDVRFEIRTEILCTIRFRPNRR